MAKKETLTVQLMKKQRELEAALFQLNQARMDIESMSREIMELRRVEAEPDRVEEPEAEVPRPAPIVTRPARHIPAHFAAAREYAMRTGKCTKVVTA
jgi:hypothetical protein